jgi:AraC-like DNA-binding protein
MDRPDHHNEIELNFLTKGWVTYLLGGSSVRINEGQLAVFWGSIPHQVMDCAEDSEYFVVTIPFSWFLQFELPEVFTQTLLKGAILIEDDNHRAEFERQRFALWESDLREAVKVNEKKEIVLLEIQARLRRMAQRAQASAAPDHKAASRVIDLQNGSIKKVEQIACFIARCYREPLNAESIGKAVGVHPNYAMNLFRRTFGTTMIDYLTSHRISHAQRLLITTDKKILDVAMDSGFNSLSRFNHVFRNTCGLSPKEYRRKQGILCVA